MPPAGKTSVICCSMKQTLLGSFCLHVQVQEGCCSRVTGVHSLLGTLVWGVLGAGVKRVTVPGTPSPSGRKRSLSCGGLGISRRAVCSLEAKPMGRGRSRRCFLPTLENYTEHRLAHWLPSRCPVPARLSSLLRMKNNSVPKATAGTCPLLFLLPALEKVQDL